MGVFNERKEQMMKKEFLDRFGKNIRKRRKELNLSQLTLAEYSDSSVNSINNIERGVSNPSLNIACKIAKALKVHISDLIYDYIPSED